MWKISRMVFSMVLIFAVAIACEGPAGTDGPQGPSGPTGPVGPAGEDGSVIYAGSGQADNSTGAEGDYYLNQNTGELYGPKDENGWGNPIIVLMGEDGQDGADGQDGVDGQDGEDGSVIHAGDGPPADDLGTDGDYYFDKSSGEFYGPKDASGWGTPTDLSGEDGQDGTDGQDGSDGQDGEDGSRIYSGSGAPDASLGVVGDYYLDKSSYDLYGPKTSKGWGGPLNLKGADGSDNVTRYIYPNSIDFTSTYNKSFSLNAIGINSEEDLAKHVFLVYLKYEDWSIEGTIYYQLPGYGYNEDTFYATYHYWSDRLGQANLSIIRQDGPGEVYNELEIVRIEAGDYDYPSYKVAEQHTIPDHLDTSDYEAVAGYYGFYRE